MQTYTDASAGASPAVIWEEASGRLKQRLSNGTFSTWLGRATPVSLEGDNLVLSVPSSFAREWIEARYLDLIRQVASDAAGRSLDVTLLAGAEEVAEEPLVEELPRDAAAEDSFATSPSLERSEFHPKYSFDSFVIGASNRFAHAAALAAAEAPAQAYNPLFVYGGAGLGKTHLLHAVGRYVQEFHAHLSVRYVSAEQFMNEFIFALKHRTIPDFHSRYRRVDLLLIDDIQFLEGKERTQEEFFHTFNALHPMSQLVITSDRPPKKIATLEERLRTRFEWGLITDIQPPDLETRLAIIQKKSESDRLYVPPEAMSFIASRIQTNIRELEGALIRVAAYASLTRSNVTLELTQSVLQSLLPNANETRVTPDLAISVTAEYFDITPEQIRSPNRSRPLVTARQMAMYLCRELTDLSLPEIGRRFGGRDHSTVLYAASKIREQLKQSESCYEQVGELTTRIRQRAARG